jgi:hypothetical protein
MTGAPMEYVSRSDQHNTTRTDTQPHGIDGSVLGEPKQTTNHKNQKNLSGDITGVVFQILE